MRIAIVVLPVWSVKTAPLGAAYVATSLLEAGHEVRVFDLNAELWRSASAEDKILWHDGAALCWEGELGTFLERAFPRIETQLDARLSEIADSDFDAIGFSVYSTSAYTTRLAIERIRGKTNRMPKVFLGGPYVERELVRRVFPPTSFDAAVEGEGEAAAVQLVQCWESGTTLDNVPGLLYPDGDGILQESLPRTPVPPDSLPLPSWALFDLDAYAGRQLPLMMSRGCVARCAFCCEVGIWGPFRMRSPAHIFSEMERGMSLHGINSFYLSDSLLNGDHENLEALCDLILDAGVSVVWAGFARIDRRLTPNLLSKMRRAGCQGVIFGLESASPNVLRQMRKGFTDTEASRAIRDAHRAGIRVDLSMIVGFPGETDEDFERTLAFLAEHREMLSCVATGETCGLSPGSVLLREPARFGIATDEGGRALWDPDGGWYTEDRSNTIHIRQDRLRRMRRFLDEQGLERAPSD